MQALKPVPGYPGYYADAHGKVFSAKRHQFRGIKAPYPLEPWRDHAGYLHVTLDLGARKRERIAVHAVVALAFHGVRPEGLVTSHLNGDKNDNRPCNLAYVTQRENIEQKRLHGTMRCGDKSHMSRLSDATCREMLRALDRGVSRRKVAEAYGVSISHVYGLRAGRIRKHLTQNRFDPAAAA